MSTRGLLCVGVAAAVCVLASRTIGADGEAPVRWVAPGQVQSTDTIRGLLSAAIAEGVNTLLVPIALEPSTTLGISSPGAGPAGNAGFDPIAELLRQARERGVRVHGWVTIGLAAPVGELPASRDHVIYQHPEWLMLPRALAVEMLALDPRTPDYLGRLVRWTRANAGRADGLYLSPAYPEATAYVAGSLNRLLQRYAVDGLVFDVRTPGSDFDYSRRALEAFRGDVRPTLAASMRIRMDEVETIDPFAYAEEFPGEWLRLRRTRLTGLIARLRHTVRTVHPAATVSALIADAAVSANALQDWRTWMDTGLVDGLTTRDGPVGRILSSYDSVVDAAPQPVVTSSSPP
jgi:uncharacterized lipoprotein YddW (UPF0748 family)